MLARFIEPLGNERLQVMNSDLMNAHRRDQDLAHDSSSLSTGDGLRVWFNITHGFQARMLLRSEIAERMLAAGVRLIISSPNADEEYFRREFSHPLIDLVRMPYQFRKLEHQMLNVRQYVLMNPKLGETLNHKQEAMKKQNPRRYRISRALNSIFGRVSFLRRGYMAAESWLFKGQEFDELLSRYRPHLVVTGTPGFNLHDVHLLRAARRKKLPTATVMLSWDNLTSKGFMNGVPDHLLVWSDVMAADAVRYHDYPRQRIKWCGAAQFDHYHSHRATFDRDQWRRQQGIPKHVGLIVYGTINPPLCPHEPEIVKSIIAAMRGQRFRRPCHLWVRLHPQVVKGDSRHIIQPYLDLAAEDVRIEVPPVQSDQLSWDLPKTDVRHLADLIGGSDMVVTTSSTLSIDAACLDKPIINVFFDGATAVDPAVSTRRFMLYTHYANILRTGGIAVAETERQFIDAVNRYLDDPTADQIGRQAILTQQLNQFDGRASQRTAETLMKLAGASAGSCGGPTEK